MSRKSLIERQYSRKLLVQKYRFQRRKLKQQIKKASSLAEGFHFKNKLHQLPRDSSAVRLHNRCLISGRPKGFFRDFQLSRHFLRELALSGLLPGVKKASW